MTPDQRAGSPGVKLTKMPSGQACLRPALRKYQLASKGMVRDGMSYNSASRCCRLTDGSTPDRNDAMTVSVSDSVEDEFVHKTETTSRGEFMHWWAVTNADGGEGFYRPFTILLNVMSGPTSTRSGGAHGSGGPRVWAQRSALGFTAHRKHISRQSEVPRGVEILSG